jgi:hypothetical protein
MRFLRRSLTELLYPTGIVVIVLIYLLSPALQGEESPGGASPVMQVVVGLMIIVVAGGGLLWALLGPSARRPRSPRTDPGFAEPDWNNEVPRRIHVAAPPTSLDSWRAQRGYPPRNPDDPPA